MSKRMVCTASCVARDPYGRTYQINEFTEVFDFTTSTGQGEVPGWKYLKTSDGQEVAYVSKGRYKLVLPEIELKSDDPNAI